MPNCELRRALFIALAVCAPMSLLTWAPATAEAAPLNLVSPSPPVGDVTAEFGSVSYTLDANPTTGTLTAHAFPDDFDTTQQGFDVSSFDLSLKVLRASGAVVSGTVDISGTTNGNNGGTIYSGTLLHGDITTFGFHDPPLGTPGAGSKFEFIVHVTSGALLAPYYGSGYAGIIMNIGNGSASPAFTGVFTSAFHNDGTAAVSDTFPTTPEPSTFILLAMGAIPVAWQLRRRARRAG